jgi:hypothetical protein
MFRSSLLVSIVVVGASVWGLTSIGADKAPTHEQVCAAESFLFVQDAASGSYDGERLTLDRVGPTIFFTDRPYRVFGHVQPNDFVGAWTRGPNSFATDPPNAVLSLLGEANAQSCLVELSDPKLTDGNFSYKVKILNGKLPAKFEAASLFIDNEAWAAVGGFAAGHMLARRRDREMAEAHAAGEAKGAATAQNSSYYYNATPPPPPPPPPGAPPAAASVPDLLSKAVQEMQAYAQTASPQNAQYVQQLIKNVQTVSSDYSKVAH